MKMGQYISFKCWHHPAEGNVNPEDGGKIFLTSFGPKTTVSFPINSATINLSFVAV